MLYEPTGCEPEPQPEPMSDDEPTLDDHALGHIAKEYVIVYQSRIGKIETRRDIFKLLEAFLGGTGIPAQLTTAEIREKVL